jgi:hypothetical protein
MWMVGYHHFNFFPHQNFLIKKILGLMLYKTDFLVLRFKSPLLKSKLNLLNFLFFIFFNTHINHLSQIFLIHDTKMSLHKYV